MLDAKPWLGTIGSAMASPAGTKPARRWLPHRRQRGRWPRPAGGPPALRFAALLFWRPLCFIVEACPASLGGRSKAPSRADYLVSNSMCRAISTWPISMFRSTGSSNGSKALDYGSRRSIPTTSSLDRKRIVFSAKREGATFDIGLVSMDGSDIPLVPDDPPRVGIGGRRNDGCDGPWAPRRQQGEPTSCTTATGSYPCGQRFTSTAATPLSVDLPEYADDG